MEIQWKSTKKNQNLLNSKRLGCWWYSSLVDGYAYGSVMDVSMGLVNYQYIGHGVNDIHPCSTEEKLDSDQSKYVTVTKFLQSTYDWVNCWIGFDINKIIFLVHRCDVYFFSFEVRAFVKLYFFLIFRQHGVRGVFLVEVVRTSFLLRSGRVPEYYRYQDLLALKVARCSLILQGLVVSHSRENPSFATCNYLFYWIVIISLSKLPSSQATEKSKKYSKEKNVKDKNFGSFVS